MPVSKRIIPLLALSIAAFSPVVNADPPVENYYSFRFLKTDGEPREARVIRHDAAGRRQVIQNGILVSYKNRNAKKVMIAGDFNSWTPAPMERSVSGVWYYLYSDPDSDVQCRYKLVVDGLWTSDPGNPNRDDDGAGSYVSLLGAPRAAEGTQLSFRRAGRDYIEFRLYKPEARMVSLVGDFNNWNPENDLLEKDHNGVWRLKKRLTPGSYRYRYIVDGRWMPDLYNENTASDSNGKLCSLLKVP
ncbi:MAG TPA: hypothetical protein ENN21_05065 [Spirochaetes bacterium]|nr:hypothetical protein [Spirochaetota bacterium]